MLLSHLYSINKNEDKEENDDQIIVGNNKRAVRSIMWDVFNKSADLSILQ